MSEHWSSPNGCHPDCPACEEERVEEDGEPKVYCMNQVCEWEAIHEIEREGDKTLHLCHQCKTAYDMGWAAANTKKPCDTSSPSPKTAP